MNQKRKISLITTIVYTAIMALGMYTMKHIVGSSYELPTMPKTLVWFELIMTIIALFIYFKYFKNDVRKFKTKNPNKIFIAAFIVMVINILVMLYNFLNTSVFEGKDITIILSIIFATLFVGISEELIFRGIVLPAFLEGSSRVKAILFSSFLFAIFHGVNILGGVTLGGALIQIANSMLMGLTFTCLILEMGRIWPIIIFHFLYDCILINAGYTGAELGITIVFGGVFTWILGIVMFSYVVYKEKKEKIMY